MAENVIPIPIEHRAVTHEIEPSADSGPRPLTLIELVEAVSEVTDDEEEIIATVGWMIDSGRVKLLGEIPSPPSRGRFQSWESIEPESRRLA